MVHAINSCSFYEEVFQESCIIVPQNVGKFCNIKWISHPICVVFTFTLIYSSFFILTLSKKYA